MKKQLTITKVILAIGFSVLMYSWYLSCWKNHSKTLKAIGQPMQENVLAFFKEHQRYPNLEETKVLFEKSGCITAKRNITREYKTKSGETYEWGGGYDCEFNSMMIGFGATIGDLTINSDAEPYGFGASVGNTRCSVSFRKNGIVSSYRGQMKCYQDSCLMKDWGH